MIPRLEVLPPAQRRLWDELGGTPRHFTLYGGTALALKLGHRQSIDFDFFSEETFDAQLLAATIPYLKNARLELAPNTINAMIDCDGPVRVSLFGGLSRRLVRRPEILSNPDITIASTIDIAATKLAAVLSRSEAKDYVDIHAIVTMTEVDLAQALAAAKHAYGSRFNTYAALRTLSYFGDGDLHKVPGRTRRELTAAVRAVDLDRLPPLGIEADREHRT